jgi:arginyl-tRNA synthetase
MREQIIEIIKKVILNLQKEGSLSDFKAPEVFVDWTKEEKFGDYSSNIAMLLAKKAGKNPMEIAEIINRQLTTDNLQQFEKIKVAAPGYLNFYLSKEYLQNKIGEINSAKENFGQSETGKGIKVNNEFISANPTGPLHLGNGRGGFYGDSLSRVLRKSGVEVVNEYYVNDAGEQVMKLGHSVLKDAEAVYAGDYIDELNKKYKNSDIREAGEKAAGDILKNIIQKTIREKMQISFDEWMSEKQLYAKGYVDRAIDLLQEKELTYEKDGALWLKTTAFGDDKDRVLVKSDGQKTYFASDCGYILNKKERGFTKIIEIWGADHHGYIRRFQAAAEALEFQKEQLKFIIVQLVRLVKDGKEVRMSKRAGNVVFIDDLIDEVGHDTTRFFFLMYSPDTHMNFDLGLAKERSEKNPVFYVQYAHARICSILRKADELKITKDEAAADLSKIIHEKELSLIKELGKFPELVEEIAESYAAHKLPQYAIRLADKFHSFYNDCRVLDETEPAMSAARLELVKATKIVLAETLRLIGVDAPEKM